MTIDARPVLVTGAGGCIGAAVVATLLRDGGKPVVFDIADNRRRLRMLLDDDVAAAVPWIVGDIRDSAAVTAAVRDNGIGAIVHLAAMQVPFCNADPVRGAGVNVVGHVNVFEAARAAGISSIAYASSVAALSPGDAQWPATLYGAYKLADEAIADVYAKSWGVASIGIRPHTAYGPGRDQGVTAAPTKAMLAAAAGVPFTIPFSGPIMMQHTEEIAGAFIGAALADIEGAHVCDLAGADTDIAAIVRALDAVAPGHGVKVSGDPLPFVSGLDDSPLRALIGEWQSIDLDTGVHRTIAAFRTLLRTGQLKPEDAWRGPLGDPDHAPYKGV
jgi:nucleoside-diphosphate-sugar epimerase